MTFVVVFYFYFFILIFIVLIANCYLLAKNEKSTAMLNFVAEVYFIGRPRK